jgi:excisionase family DNA binding protein
MGSGIRRDAIYLNSPDQAPTAESAHPPKGHDGPAILSLSEAADYLQISKAHLSNLINGKVRGVPPVRSFRLGRRVLFKRAWIDQWIEMTAHAGPAKC